jgi:hypothetical protein
MAANMLMSFICKILNLGLGMFGMRLIAYFAKKDGGYTWMTICLENTGGGLFKILIRLFMMVVGLFKKIVNFVIRVVSPRPIPGLLFKKFECLARDDAAELNRQRTEEANRIAEAKAAADAHEEMKHCQEYCPTYDPALNVTYGEQLAKHADCWAACESGNDYYAGGGMQEDGLDGNSIAEGEDMAGTDSPVDNSPFMSECTAMEDEVPGDCIYADTDDNAKLPNKDRIFISEEECQANPKCQYKGSKETYGNGGIGVHLCPFEMAAHLKNRQQAHDENGNGITGCPGQDKTGTTYGFCEQKDKKTAMPV